MRHTVIGGTGLVGNALARRLAELGQRPLVVSRRPLPIDLAGRVEHVHGSFDSPEALDAMRYGDGAIVHCASATNPSSAERDPIADMQANLIPTMRLIAALAEHPPRRVIFVSSGGTVYGQVATLPVSEDHPTNPFGAYGIAKLAIEKYVLAAARRGQLRATIFRAGNLYGPGQDSRRGQGVIDAFLRRVVAGKAVEIWGTGEVARDYLYIDDMIELLVRAITSDVDGVFNAGTGQAVSLNQILDLIAELVDHKIDVRRGAARYFDVGAIALDSRAAYRSFGWAATTTLPVGIKHHMDWLRSTVHTPGGARRMQPLKSGSRESP